MNRKSSKTKNPVHHVVVISLDALSESEWPLIPFMPHLSRLMEIGSWSRELRSVFPTHTYTAHTTMVTGVHPDKHGIIQNHPFQPFVPPHNQEWYWYQRQVKVPTIYDLTRKSGLKSAGLFWPVTGKSSINWNIPEILALEGENQVLKILKNSSKAFMLNLERRIGKKRVSTKQPDFDDFVALAASETIKRKKPNLTLIHLCDLDNTKHTSRIESPAVKASLLRQDRRVGEIMEAVRAAGMEERTAFILLGDHGQFSIDTNIHLNNLLRDEGLIYEEKGEMRWRAYLQTTGGNAFLHLKEGDSEAELRALEVLKKAAKQEKYGIQTIYNRKNLDDFRAAPGIQYGIEARAGFNIDETLSDETIEDYGKKGILYANHGYSPDKEGYKCLFFACGPGFKAQNNLGPIEMVDIAPTIAELLGLRFYDCDGVSLASSLFNDEVLSTKTE
jgi:predicted AlkP superfamily pyrophosphatase or phosphodiesterase